MSAKGRGQGKGRDGSPRRSHWHSGPLKRVSGGGPGDGLKHLVGEMLPPAVLPSHPGPATTTNLAKLATSLGQPSSLILCLARGPDGLGVADSGDTARARSWQLHQRELAALNYQLACVSACPVDALRVWGTREGLSYTLLSDTGLALARLMGLPMVEAVAGGRVYEHLTLIAHDREVTQVFYPVDPRQDASAVMKWLRWVHA
jgi:peroxiredoxin